MSHGADQYLLADGAIEINAGREMRAIRVANTGDRAIQVGSHFHFFEVNRALRFERAAAFGMRLDIPAGTAVRFEPGDRKEVPLVALGGSREVHGLNGLTEGGTTGPDDLSRALRTATERGFIAPDAPAQQEPED